jgi:hypothetical protein
MPDLDRDDPVEINAANDAHHTEQLEEAMASIYKVGEFNYDDNRTEKNITVTFAEIMSQNIEIEGLLPVMLEFFQADHLCRGRGNLIGTYDVMLKGDAFNDAVRSAVNKYITGELMGPEFLDD